MSKKRQHITDIAIVTTTWASCLCAIAVIPGLVSSIFGRDTTTTTIDHPATAALIAAGLWLVLYGMWRSWPGRRD
jgi:hypothetical protein